MGGIALAVPGILEDPHIDESAQTHKDRWVVRVFNNETNTYDEVITILMIATHCTEEEAFIETWEIDHLGSSVVHHGNEGECETVGDVIRTIGITVEVSQEP